MRSDVAALFGRGRNFASLASSMADGAPHVIALWTGVEDGKIVFATVPGTRKARNIERDPRVALATFDLTNPYRSATVRGRVGETISGQRANEIIDRLCSRYTPGTPRPPGEWNVYVVGVEHESFVELAFEF